MSIEALVLAAFAAGFLGSPHCLGMCGGIVTAFGLSMQNLSPTQRWLLIAGYHTGRLLSYAALGIIAGMLGTALLAPLAQSFWPRGVLGGVLILLGLSMLGLPLLNQLERFGHKLWQSLAPVRQRLFPIQTLPRALGAGLLWGLLPCGLVYGALLLAASSASVTHGALLMLVFGLGTLPMLVLAGQITQWLQTRIKRWHLRQINGAILILAGVWMFAPLGMKAMHGDHAHMDHSQME
ncbi:MAG: sulfite exporter TauE/SafE family protein [Pseudomonadota bacterium]|nr:sulfite exporter TauE/SafE family protein [Pseudomonadota bacterium]